MQRTALDFIPAAERSEFIWSLHIQNQSYSYYGTSSYPIQLVGRVYFLAIFCLYAVLNLSPLTVKWNYDVLDDQITGQPGLLSSRGKRSGLVWPRLRGVQSYRLIPYLDEIALILDRVVGLIAYIWLLCRDLSGPERRKRQSHFRNQHEKSPCPRSVQHN